MLKLLKQLRTKEIIMAIICATLVLGQVYFDLQLPDYMSELTKLIKTSGTMQEIGMTGLKMLGVTLASAILCVICGYLAAKVAAGFSYSIRENLFNHVIHLSQGEMNKLSVPSLITRTTNDVVQVQMVVAMGLQMIIKAPVMAIWAIIKIFGKNTELSLVTAGFVVAIITVITIIILSVVKRFRLVQRLTDKINRVTRENLTGINVVHAFNAEEYQNEKFDGVNTQIMNTQLKNQRTFAIMHPYMSMAINFLSLTIYWLGAALLSKTVGDEKLELFSNILVFSTYANFVVMSFMMLVMIFMMMPAAEVSAERINEVMRTTSSIKEGSENQSDMQGEVEFKNVYFRYPGAGDDDLTDINFKVKKGQTLAIIGATGSGKTTLVDLICRFYDATQGEILLNGKNIKDYTFDYLYNKISIMPQKAVLFSGTVNENVTFGECESGFSEEDVDEAISLSQSKEFVDKMPEGKDSMIAQAGKNISGGQKQRLSVARGLARKPEILIFDDTFSALDYKTDKKLRSDLKSELQGTTSIIVAQRISTIRQADDIIVLDNGRIAGQGTHEELLKNCEVYREIAKSQLSEKELGIGGTL